MHLPSWASGRRRFSGLAPSDLNLQDGTVTIRYQISRSGRKAVRIETKTAASTATIPLPQFVTDRLRDHLERQDAERPVVPFGDSLAFVTQRGLAISGSWFAKHFQALLIGAGLPTMRLHDMRHGAVSLLWIPELTLGSPRNYSATRQAAGSR